MNKELKSGYTTGSCCVAGVIAGLSSLLWDENLEEVKFLTKVNKELKIPVNRIRKRNNFVTTSIIKYSGDDPDVTNGREIFTKIKIVQKFTEDERGYKFDNIFVRAGRGIGVVTKKGLQCQVGKYAINPKPLEMIIEEAKKILKTDKRKIEIMFYIPSGRQIAKKTFNEKLGVIGGISILGSTGILNPMSEEALKESLYLELKVLKENNKKDWIIFSFGNHGKKYCEDMGLDTSNLIVISNYIGYMLDMAEKLEYRKIILVGHIGKAIKIAGGIYNTHSKIADGRIEIMVSNAFEIFEKEENIRKILKSNTVEEACSYIENKEFFRHIANKVALKSKEYLKSENIECESLIFSFKEKLGESDNFYKLVEEVKR